MNPFAIAVLAGMMTGGLSGWFFTGLVYQAEIADMQIEQAQSLAAAEQLYRQRYQAETQRGDALSAQLAATESALETRTQEVHRALQNVTTGKRCLDSAAVRLLNRPAARDDPIVPETAGESVAESTAFATDTDVAGWINDAQGYYNTCRSRLNTLIDFESGRPDDHAKQ